ncbi:unnamed protein product [Clonostachys byssicola]|uniref:Rhodopsin domain-containing protein n=1 Tax=Clonostachys byssicola TaxID=160290 RepID=A0A9N9UTJ4_9HYPO|nr:unnamed protein product [Clonostachys byssicola]
MDLSGPLNTDNAISNGSFLATGISLTVITTLFIAVRLFVSIKQIGNFWLDDYAMVVGLGFLVATFVLTYEQQALTEKVFLKVKEMTTDELPLLIPDLLAIHKVGLGSLVVSNLSTWFTKAPLLLLLNRIFGIKNWLKIFVYITLAVSLLIVVGITGYSGRLCDPKGQWSPEFTVGCMDAGAIGNLICGCVGLAVDIVIFILPIPMIMQLHLPLRKKIGVIVVFATGFMGIAAGIVGTYSRVKTLNGSAADRQISTLCVILEATVTIAVGCVPALYYVWRTIISKNPYVAKFVTRATTRATRTRTQKKRTHLNSRVEQIDERGLQSERALESSYDGYIRMGTPKKSHEMENMEHAERDPWDARAGGDDSVPRSYWVVQTGAQER